MPAHVQRTRSQQFSTWITIKLLLITNHALSNYVALSTLMYDTQQQASPKALFTLELRSHEENNVSE